MAGQPRAAVHRPYVIAGAGSSEAETQPHAGPGPGVEAVQLRPLRRQHAAGVVARAEGGPAPLKVGGDRRDLVLAEPAHGGQPRAGGQPPRRAEGVPARDFVHRDPVTVADTNQRGSSGHCQPR